MLREKLNREDLLEATLDHETVATVDIKKVTIPRGMGAGKHFHPCPVVGYIVSGKVLFQVQGEEMKILNAGDGFYEPKNKIILYSTMHQQKASCFYRFLLERSRGRVDQNGRLNFLSSVVS